jgi:hypothetical protein
VERMTGPDKENEKLLLILLMYKNNRIRVSTFIHSANKNFSNITNLLLSVAVNYYTIGICTYL